ncbi:MAG: diguanylate cyclase [Syntrophales bacterium]
MKLTIRRKLLLGYFAMALLTVLASLYAVLSLGRLSDLAYAIINEDVPIVETANSLAETLLAQESAEKKFLILKDPELTEIFWSLNREFKAGLEAMGKNRSTTITKRVALIGLLHRQYGEIFQKQIDLVQENMTDEARALSEQEGKPLLQQMASSLRDCQKRGERDVDTRMNLINEQGLRASRITIMLSLVSLLGGIGVALFITYNISIPLRKLEKATGVIAQGNFDPAIQMDRDDEIGSLAQAFGVMTERLKELEALNLDASPLTGLPGNLAIERELERRRAERKMFSLCQVDLDNFKPFADKYGYAWGSEIIKEVAKILTQHLDAAGEEDVFVAHIGGDDFVLIAEPGVAEAMSRQLVEEFESQIQSFYSTEDRERGSIIGKDRKGQVQKFPLITVSVAIVTDDGSRFPSALAMAKKAAELKEYAKTLPGSNYVKQDTLGKAVS